MSGFPISDENINEILNVNENLNVDILFNVDEIMKDYSNPDLEQFKPKGGYEFTDKSNYNEGIGIYHSHLKRIEGKLWVLIWYLKENEDNYYNTIFEVMPHPMDDYHTVLSDIKNDKLAINPNTWRNFSEKFKISRFLDFIRKFKED